MYSVIKEKQFTGVQYEEMNTAIYQHHTNQGEMLRDVETIYDNNGDTVELTEAEYQALLTQPDKWVGVEIDGVLCSASKEDMWGLTSALEFVKLGNSTSFKFDNGSTYELTPANYETFYAVWAAFRASFFEG